MKSKLETVIDLMIQNGESACFIGQVIKLYFLQTNFTALHFYEGGASKEQNEYRFEKAVRYASML